jgi:hypothetical protein
MHSHKSYPIFATGIKSLNLNYYIATRETISAEFKNRDEAKGLFLCALNKDTLYCKSLMILTKHVKCA